MTQIVSSTPFCLESSTQLTRPASEKFYRIDGSDGPKYNPGLKLDSAETGYDSQGYFDSIVRKQINESSPVETKSVYHPPTNMSNAAMTKFSLGKARLDPQRIVPSELKINRNHPSAIKPLRYISKEKLIVFVV